MPAKTLLPDGFVFSQSSLQDFVDCPRRFELRYLLQVAWPAVPGEPALENERFMERGAFFHRLAHQRWLGVPAGRLQALAQDQELSRWWDNFTSFPAPAGRLLPEASLSTPLGERRLMAKFDLLVARPGGELTIYDWKTSRRRPRRDWLRQRLQTRVYPFLLACAGSGLNGGEPPEPEAIEMTYWFADFPDEPEQFRYSTTQFREDQAYLEGLLARIAVMGGAPDRAGSFPLTDHSERCAFCVYRSLCARGETAGQTSEQEEAGDDDFFIDFDQVVEISL